jgi:squalene-associated FAD-dependent desaturase
MTPSVTIIGGGLAGLAAATALAPRGLRVTIVEARPRLGGRAGSFIDAVTGQLIDTCQHVSMGCCTNFAHFCRTVGIDHLLSPQPVLYFKTVDGRISPWRASRLPAPLHYAWSFLRAHFLSWPAKLRIVYGLLAMRSSPTDADPPFCEWLRQHGQTRETIDRFWGVVLVSALNEDSERVGLRYARQVFLEGFLNHRQAGVVYVPAVPLGRLYGEELQAWLQQQGVTVRLNQGVQQMVIEGDRVCSLSLRNGEPVESDWYISTVPFDRMLGLVNEEVIQQYETFRRLRHLEASPITSVHLWYDCPVMDLPHAVLVGCVGQWVFNRGETRAGEHYVQVVVSAARQFRGLDQEEIQQLISTEMTKIFPACAEARLVRCRVVTEKSATFSPLPGVDEHRPRPLTPVGNLLLAGDWTQTGWPATMEGAVRSGYLAAEQLLRNLNRPERLLQPGLDGPAPD